MRSYLYLETETTYARISQSKTRYCVNVQPIQEEHIIIQSNEQDGKGHVCNENLTNAVA